MGQPDSRAPGAWVDGGRVRRKRDGVPRARGPLPHVRQQGRIGVVSGFFGGVGVRGTRWGRVRKTGSRAKHTHTHTHKVIMYHILHIKKRRKNALDLNITIVRSKK